MIPISMIDRLMTHSAQMVVFNAHMEITLYQDSFSFQMLSLRVRLCTCTYMRTDPALPRNMKPGISTGIPRHAQCLKILHVNARNPCRKKKVSMGCVHRTSGAAAAAISLLIGAAPVSVGGLSNKFRQNCGGSRGR